MLRHRPGHGAILLLELPPHFHWVPPRRSWHHRECAL